MRNFMKVIKTTLSNEYLSVEIIIFTSLADATFVRFENASASAKFRVKSWKTSSVAFLS